jgi:hypothetical protein
MPAPSSLRKTRLRSNPTTWINCCLRMLLCFGRQGVGSRLCRSNAQYAALNRFSVPVSVSSCRSCLEPAAYSHTLPVVALFYHPACAAPSAVAPEYKRVPDSSSPVPIRRRSDIPCVPLSLLPHRPSPLAQLLGCCSVSRMATTPPLHQLGTLTLPSECVVLNRPEKQSFSWWSRPWGM